MAVKTKFDFKEKEGKFFAPIVGRETKKTVRNGVTERRIVPKSGIKGVYAMTRLELPIANATTKTELYAMSTEVFISSR